MPEIREFQTNKKKEEFMDLSDYILQEELNSTNPDCTRIGGVSITRASQLYCMLKIKQRILHTKNKRGDKISKKKDTNNFQHHVAL